MMTYPGMNPVYHSARSPVMGRGGMAASSQPLATAAGLNILAMEGNAADAAVAMAAVLNVTEPTSTGLGGDMFCLFFEAATGKITALNGSGRAPAALSLELLQEQGFSELPPYHPSYCDRSRSLCRMVRPDCQAWDPEPAGHPGTCHFPG